MSPRELEGTVSRRTAAVLRLGFDLERLRDRRANAFGLLMPGIYLGLNVSAHFDIDLRQGLRLGAGLSEWEDRSMSRYRFELATPADDADLRRILAETPMAGRIAVSFRREPSYFEGGGGRRGLSAGDRRPRRPRRPNRRVRLPLSVGRGTSTGSRERIGYLSSLRCSPTTVIVDCSLGVTSFFASFMATIGRRCI